MKLFKIVLQGFVKNIYKKLILYDNLPRLSNLVSVAIW